MFIALGIIAGLLGFFPLWISLRLSKRVTATSNFGYGALLMLGVFASLIVLIAGAAFCYFFAKDNLVIFAISTAVSIAFIAIIYGVYTVIRRNKTSKQRFKEK